MEGGYFEMEAKTAHPGGSGKADKAGSAASDAARNARGENPKAPDGPRPEAGAGTPPPEREDQPAEEAVNADVLEASKDLEVLRDRMLRLQADFDNFRKRTARDRSEIYKRANEDLMAEMLPVIDHIELGIAKAAEHGAEAGMIEGWRLIADQLLSVLQRFGLTPLDAAGAIFDPTLHEAIAHLPSKDAPAGTVVKQTRRGYMIGSKLLRPAQVFVSSGDATADASGPAED